jgi:hypothetical protein
MLLANVAAVTLPELAVGGVVPVVEEGEGDDTAAGDFVVVTAGLLPVVVVAPPASTRTRWLQVPAASRRSCGQQGRAAAAAAVLWQVARSCMGGCSMAVCWAMRGGSAAEAGRPAGRPGGCKAAGNLAALLVLLGRFPEICPPPKT